MICLDPLTLVVIHFMYGQRLPWYLERSQSKKGKKKEIKKERKKPSSRSSKTILDETKRKDDDDVHRNRKIFFNVEANQRYRMLPRNF